MEPWRFPFISMPPTSLDQWAVAADLPSVAAIAAGLGLSVRYLSNQAKIALAFAAAWLGRYEVTYDVAPDVIGYGVLLVPKDMKPGEYSQPTVYTTEQGKKGVRIIYLRNRTQPHRENMKDDYNRISQRALEEKKQNILAKWFSEKLKGYYIYVDPEFGSCSDLAPWLAASAKR